MKLICARLPCIADSGNRIHELSLIVRPPYPLHPSILGGLGAISQRIRSSCFPTTFTQLFELVYLLNAILKTCPRSYFTTTGMQLYELFYLLHAILKTCPQSSSEFTAEFGSRIRTHLSFSVLRLGRDHPLRALLLQVRYVHLLQVLVERQVDLVPVVRPRPERHVT
jgi:hypothetical protein